MKRLFLLSWFVLVAFLSPLKAQDNSTIIFDWFVGSGEVIEFSVPEITTLPTIAGTAEVPNTLTVTPGTVTGGGVVNTYQWERDGTPIDGATGETYQLTQADFSTDITVVQTATNSEGSDTAESEATSIAAQAVPVIASVPVITGTAEVGNTLTASTSSVTGLFVTETYQWERDGVEISGATNLTYDLVSDDYGVDITFVHTATNDAGSDSKESAATSIPEEDLNIVNIDIVYKEIQRTDETISIAATPDVSVTSWTWVIYDADTKAVIETKTDEDPVFTAITTTGLYDLYLVAKNSVDTYEQYFYDAFYVDQPVLEEGDCDEVWDISTGSFSHSYTDVSRPGYVIGIKNSGTGDFYINNLYSSDPSDPVRIVKLGSTKSTATKAATAHQIYVEGKFQNVVWNGFLPDGTRGIRWVVPSATANSQQVMIRAAWTGIHFMGMEFDHQRNGSGETNNLGACINFQPWDPGAGGYTGATYNVDTWVAENTIIFSNVIEEARQEGIYFLYNNDAVVGSYRPYKARGTVIARNWVYNTGRDLYQVASSVYGRFHDNYGESGGLNQAQSHENGLSWNAGNGGNKVFNNVFRNVKMGFNTQSGLTPWDVEAGEDAPVLDDFYNNIFEQGTIPGGGSTEPYFFFFQTAQNSGDGDIGWRFYNNTIICNKEFGGIYSHTSSFAINQNLFVNNIILKNGTGADHDLFDWTAGGGADPTGLVANNLVDAFADIDDLLFTDPDNGDYTLSSFSSPAYTGSPTDLVALLPEMKFNFHDASGYPLLAPGEDFTFGAYSGFQNRENDPASSGTLTYTTAFGASSITTNGFTVDCQPDQNGWLYVVITPGADSDPTTAQILAGTDASDGTPEEFFIMENGPDGIMVSEVISSLTSETAYDVHAVFVNVYGNIHTVTKLNDVTTEADVDPFTISDFWISSLNRTRLYVTTSSEAVAASDFTGFTLSSGKTITAWTVVNATKGYFTVNSAYTTGDTENLTYAGGSDMENINSVALETFGSTAVTNNITSTAEQDVTAAMTQNGTFTGNDFNSNGTNPGGMRTVQAIPAGSNGYIEWQWHNDDGHNIQVGLQNRAVTFTYAWSQLLLNIRFENNTNIGAYQGQTFRAALGGVMTTNHYYRIRTNGTDLIAEYSANGSSWTNLYTASGAATGLTMYGAVQTTSTTANRKVLNVRMQCDDGLIVDTE